MFYCTAFKGGSPFLCVPDCDICPSLRKQLTLFLGPSVLDYLDFVSQYKSDPETLQVAKTIKMCADNKLTAEDKATVLNFVVSSLSIWPGSLCAHLLTLA